MQKKDKKSKGGVRFDVNEGLKFLRKCKKKVWGPVGGGKVGQGGGERKLEVILEIQ